MWYKIWIALKVLISMTIGPAILCGIVMTALGENTASTVIYCISCFIWFRYVWNFYYPLKKETKDDIDFKDL
jgi:hypothetical protein